jgi:argininosuccinate lyase
MAENSGKRAKSARVLEGYSDTIMQAEQDFEFDMQHGRDISQARNYSEKAWLVMLIDRGIVDEQAGAKILKAIEEYERSNPVTDSSAYTPTDSFSIWSLEKILTDQLGADVAGNLNIGKTLPEPIVRLKARNACLPVIDALIDLLSMLQTLALKYKDTVMPGYTHLAQGQITTFGHYLLSVHDPLSRALAELEAAYANTNRCTLGCGALSGTSWPIDRELVADLLGFDGILENTNDCVSSADYCISILCALINIVVPVSRLTLDLHFWGSEEVAMIGVPESFSETSSMMPQKKNFGGQIERVRMESAAVIGRLQEAVVVTRNEPFADMLAVLQARYPTLESLSIVRKNLRILTGFLSTMIPDEQKMEEYSRHGFAAASELANTLVRSCGVSYRQGHHIVGTVVRLASEKNITADQVDASFVNEASEKVLGRTLPLKDSDVRSALDPSQFIASHNVRGGVAPDEVARMVEARKAEIAAANTRQKERRKLLEKAEADLNARIRTYIS